MAKEEILVVEGDATRAKALRLILEEIGGYTATQASTVFGAFKQIKVKTFDLILMNVTIQKPLDGIRLLQWTLLQPTKSQRAPVMIITSERDSKAVQQCAQAGVVGYIVDYDPTAMLDRIEKILVNRQNLSEDQVQEGIVQTLEKILDLPTIPIVYTRLEALIDGGETSADEIGQVVSLDPSITAKVLRLSNSAFFGFSRNIYSIKDAVALLGYKAVQTAVATVSTFEALGRIEEKNFNRTAFWRHSIGCGAIARVLAGKLKVAPDQAFVAGLLHDIGKVILDGYFSDSFADALQTASDKGISLFDAEKEVLPATHEAVGRHLAERWNLPAELIEVVGAHNSLKPEKSEHAKLVMLVHVADAKCRHLKVGRAGDDLVWDPQPEALEQLGTTWEAVGEWTPQMEAEIKKAESLLALA